MPFLYIENSRLGRCIFFVFFVNSCFLLIGFFVCRERNMSGKENAETEVPGKKNAERKRHDGRILPGERESGKKNGAEKEEELFFGNNNSSG